VEHLTVVDTLVEHTIRRLSVYVHLFENNKLACLLPRSIFNLV
jgi:hypothetical protein